MFKGDTFFLIINANNDTFTKTIFSYIVMGYSTLHVKYTKEIIQNTKENIGQKYFSVFGKDVIIFIYN